MSVSQILAAYPECQVAVAYVELMICRTNEDDPDHRSGWDLLMRAVPPLTVDEVLECLLSATAGEGKICRADEAHRQMQYPTFRNYLAAKMGMV